ncbi:MAG: ATP synthase subunit I [Candidatus Acidiferrales bacterium]
MNEVLHLLSASVAGLLLGGIFFGGLWWTVRRSMASRHPALWIFGSLLIRMAIVLSGFYEIGRGHWERLVACLVGFVLARAAVTWLTRTVPGNGARPAREARYAP